MTGATATRFAVSPRTLVLPLALAQFIASYAATNMNVAIGAIAHDLDTTVVGVQTAITLFLLAMAALMIPGFREGVGRMLAAAELVPITELIAACRDPKDNKFLELAVSGGADLIVSGDGDLRALIPFRGIPVVTPAAFVQGVAS